ncbi:MAG: alpha-E domain-containing protein [Phycisphaeraceae bacterium]|nr:alpha-E domain-containing protein [Phycisphaeraceae bacterium]
MLSRVANAIYWMSRYVERAESIARFIDVNLNLMLDLPGTPMNHGTAEGLTGGLTGGGAGGQWGPLIDVGGDREAFFLKYDAATEANVRQFLTFDRDNPNSILSCLWHARENARSVREAISSEMWEQLNMAHLMIRDARAPACAQNDPHDFYASVKIASHLFCGLTDTTMSRNESWHFARMGRLIERADKTSRILDVKYFILLPTPDYVGTPYDSIQWSALLKSASALEMYRKQYRVLTPEKVVEFMVLDRQFPRAMRHCVNGAEQSLHEITGTPTGAFRNAAEQRLGRLLAELDYAGVEDLIAGGLHERLDRFQLQLNNVGDAIFQTFFALQPVEA